MTSLRTGYLTVVRTADSVVPVTIFSVQEGSRMGIRGEIFSSKASTGKRTYFFNIKENRHGDLFLNMVESKKHGEASFERHSIIVFDEDLEVFLKEFEDAVKFMKKNKKPKRATVRSFNRDTDQEKDPDREF